MGLLPFYPEGQADESELETMLSGLYLATMSCAQNASGNTGHMGPISLVELNVRNSENFVARRYARVDDTDEPQHGFGFGKRVQRGVHKTRVMVLDFGRWKVRHLCHFICE